MSHLQLHHKLARPFRGDNLAFVLATKALDYWRDGALEADVAVKGKRIRERLSEIVGSHPKVNLRVRSRGMIQGLFDGPFLHFFLGPPGVRHLQTPNVR